MSDELKPSLAQRIKADIRSDVLAQNTLLTQAELSERYKVSRIPVRDALKELLADGWLVTHGKRGVKVPPLNAEQAQELYLMRLPLERLALELAFEHLNFAILGQATDILEQSKQPGHSALELGRLNWQFHWCLYQPCQRPILLKTLDQLHQQTERYIGYQSAQLNYHQTSENEHCELIEALSAKNLQKALDILHRHIEVAGRLLIEHFRVPRSG